MNELERLQRAYAAIDEPSQEAVATARERLRAEIASGDLANSAGNSGSRLEPSHGRRANQTRGRWYTDVLESRRRVRIGIALLATLVVIVVAASAFATAREFIFVRPDADGQITRIVDGVRFSLTVSRPDAHVPRSGWENGPHIGGKTRGMLISKSTRGPQGAEVMIFWTAFPTGGEAAPCSRLLKPAIGRSRTGLAAAVASAPGVHTTKRPSRVTVGGHPATFVMLTVRKDLGCDPGYFFTWRTSLGGAFWTETDVGDAIRIWIVDVGGKLLVFEAETKDSSDEVAREIRRIIGSIRFESSG